MKRLLAALVVTLGLAAMGQAVCDHRTTTCFTAVDVSGNATVGSLTNTGNSTVSGTQAVVGAVSLSTTTFTGAFVPFPKTLAQINALTSGTTFQIVVCSDCTKTSMCISSGTVNPGAWVVPIISTSNVGPYTVAHCQ